MLQGKRSAALVELADLAPTLCEAAGLPSYEGFQGKSFWKLLTGERKEDFHRDSIYCEYYNSNINHRHPLAFATCDCDGRYKLVKVHQRPGEEGCKGELYDLSEAPPERNNHYEDALFQR